MTGPADLPQREWDVLIIGTGMGGATLGYALAQAGKTVLFCEKGRSHLRDGQALRGAFAESFFAYPEAPQSKHRDLLRRGGRYTESVADASRPRLRRFIPFIGSGTGGSTAVYGAALERFFPADFTPRQHYPDATDSTLPENWPITYEELRPYYEAAEQLYRVRGTPDPCRRDSQTMLLLPAPPFSPVGQQLCDCFTQQGLHPYRLPSACEYVPGCEGSCQGYLCPNGCKNDSAKICLGPALEHHGAHLLDECEVVRLEATRHEVIGAVCRWRGQEVTLRAGVVALAAGALETPRLLLNSATPTWPDGLANASGLVGRNLMRHYVDLYALLPGTEADGLRAKELAFSDLYAANGQKFGVVQSFGALPDPPLLVAQLEYDLRQGSWPWVVPLFQLAKPVVRHFLTRLLSHRVLLASILEDLPYLENRVLPPSHAQREGSSELVVQYRIRDQERARIEAFRTRLRQIFRPYRFALLKQAENNERLAHVCGTCRFGLEPRTSVLDVWNRAHGLSNLYVVDSSFFPSSAGTNPALTIAANALRVAEHLSGRGLPNHVPSR